METFSVHLEDTVLNYNGSGFLFLCEKNGKKYFVKNFEFEGSSMVETLISALLLYVGGLPESRFVDCSLCKIHYVTTGQVGYGVYYNYVDKEFVSAFGMFVRHKDRFNDWGIDYLSVEDYLDSVPNDYSYAKERFGYICRAVSYETKLPLDSIMSYFHRQALVDALVMNVGRDLKNCYFVKDKITGKYGFCPLCGFEKSLVYDKSVGSTCKGTPFYTDMVKQVAVTFSHNDKSLLRIDADRFIREWKSYTVDDYDLNSYFRLNFKALCERLKSTKGILWN